MLNACSSTVDLRWYVVSSAPERLGNVEVDRVAVVNFFRASGVITCCMFYRLYEVGMVGGFGH